MDGVPASWSLPGASGVVGEVEVEFKNEKLVENLIIPGRRRIFRLHEDLNGQLDRCVDLTISTDRFDRGISSSSCLGLPVPYLLKSTTLYLSPSVPIFLLGHPTPFRLPGPRPQRQSTPSLKERRGARRKVRMDGVDSRGFGVVRTESLVLRGMWTPVNRVLLSPSYFPQLSGCLGEI